MKKIIHGLILLCSSTTVFANCSVSEWSVQGVEGGTASNTSIIGQKLISNITTSVNENALAISQSINLINKNLVAFEFITNMPTTMENNENVSVNGINTSGSTFDGIMLMVIKNAQNSSVNYIRPTGTTVTTPLEVNNLSNNGMNRFGIYINRQTKQIGYTLNGINKGYLWVFPNQSFNDLNFNLWNAYTGFQPSSSLIGSNISIELVTDYTKLNQPYPTGTTDICGNTI